MTHKRTLLKKYPLDSFKTLQHGFINISFFQKDLQNTKQSNNSIKQK